MNNGLIGWITERYSLQLIISLIVFILPAFCVLAFATLIPFMIWGEFWRQYVSANNTGAKKRGKLNTVLIVITICIATTMYVVWIRWLWSFSHADNTWLLDILYGKGNWS
jgi:hypothetical protein